MNAIAIKVTDDHGDNIFIISRSAFELMFPSIGQTCNSTAIQKDSLANLKCNDGAITKAQPWLHPEGTIKIQLFDARSDMIGTFLVSRTMMETMAQSFANSFTAISNAENIQA